SPSVVQPVSVTRSPSSTPTVQKSRPGSLSVVSPLPWSTSCPVKRGAPVSDPSQITLQLCGVTARGSGKKTSVSFQSLVSATALFAVPCVHTVSMRGPKFGATGGMSRRGGPELVSSAWLNVTTLRSRSVFGGGAVSDSKHSGESDTGGTHAGVPKIV